MNDFEKDFSWQKRYYSLIERILKKNSAHIVEIQVSTDDQDMKQATDFVVKIKSATIAVRIRRNVANGYRDLTLRSSRPSGVKTELEKITEGFADYYLYIWTNENKVIDFWIVDINALRKANAFSKPRKKIRNKDGTTFVSINRKEIKDANALLYTMK